MCKRRHLIVQEQEPVFDLLELTTLPNFLSAINARCNNNNNSEWTPRVYFNLFE